MSANAESQTPQQPDSKKGKRKGALLLLTLLFIIIAVAYGIYWFLVLRHYEETDDAYVAGNQVQIMAQVSGSVTKVWADNTDFVQQGDPLVTLDQTDAQQAFEKAKTQLAASVRQTRQQMINSKQLQANIDVKKTALSQADRPQPPYPAGRRQPDWPRRAARRDTVASAGRTGCRHSAIQRQPGDRAEHQPGTTAGGSAGGDGCP
jgi:multidrug resistance efflux pump